MASPLIDISLTARQVISYAAAYNGASMVRSLEIRPTGEDVYNDLEVSISLTSLGDEWAHPWRRAVSQLGSAGISWNAHEFSSFTPVISRLLEQRELRRADLTVTVSQGDQVLATAVTPIIALASSSWVWGQPLTVSAATLASFVQPHEPELALVLTAASARLAATGSTSSLDGYQSGDPAHVDQLVDALYETVRERGMTYVNPPAGWDLEDNPDTVGQRVRLPGEVLREGLATCLDSTVLMASLLEAIGLRPLIVVVPGHAFVGYWRHDRGTALDSGPARFADPVVMVRDALTDIDSARVALLETTTLCGDTHSAPAAEARRAAHAHLEADFGQGSGLTATLVEPGAVARAAVIVDVAEVRYGARILPLPVRTVAPDGTVSVVEYRGQQLTFDLIAKAIAQGGGSTSAGTLTRTAPPRMKRWQDALLDLSRRNPLLNYRFPERSSVSLFVTEQALGSIEDLLQSGAAVHLTPAPEINGEPARLSPRRTAPAALDEQLATELVANGRVFTMLSSDDYSTRLRRMLTSARSVVEETGSNGLYLALGMVSWVPEAHEGEHSAPLILVPVILKPSDRNRRFAIEIDTTGVITPNFSLAERFKQEFGLDLPKLVEPETDGAGIDIDGLIAYMREQFLAAGLRDFRVDAACSLGFFDFSTYRLWRDLQEHWPTFVQNSPLVQHLVETSTQTFVDPAVVDESDERELDEFAATLPVQADASQALAVRRAMDGATFVLQGPPGSGKSQTITNLLARALHSGKRVLFVAEKAGALGVVRDRLNSVGLGSFGLNLHDKGMRPADVRRQLTEALDAAAATDRIGFDAARRDIDRAIEPLRQYPERLHAIGELGESAYSARNKLLAIPTEAQLPVPAAFVASVDRETADDVRRRFRDARDVAARAGTAQSNAWSFARGPTEFTAEERQRCAMLVDGVAEALDRVTANATAAEYLSTIESLDELDRTQLLADRQIDLGVVDAASGQAAVQAREHVLATLQGFVLESLFSGASPRVIDAPVDELRVQATQALASFFIGRKKRVRTATERVQQYLAEGHAVERDHLLSNIAEVEKVQSSARDYIAFLLSMPALFVPPTANLLVTADREAIEQDVRTLVHDVEYTRDDGTPAAVRRRALIAAGPAAASTVGLLARRVRELFDSFEPTNQSTELWLANRTVGETLGLSVAGWRTDAHERDFVVLRRWLELCELLAPIEQHGLTEAANAVAAGTVPSHEIDMAFERGFLTSLLRKQLDDEALDAFDGARHNSHASDFGTAADTLRRLSPGVLADDMISSRGFQSDAAVGAVGELRRELGRRRGFKPIRRLLRDHWTVISRITPLVLAVPDALVRFVDGDLEPFDLVVFDEASQIKVPHAIGALGRGRGAIVVGDSRQMPPTSVAQVGANDDTDDAEPEVDDAPRDEESILTESLRAWVPETYLTWHYRSEDETLIAFSNRTYYDGRLSTLPAPTSSTQNKGLSFSKVDGRFVRQTRGAGAERGTNRAEATAIVDEIVRRVHDPEQSRHSIGVVTLNRPQQELVQTLLLATEDDAVLAALNPDEVDEPITVWNLETVQGHERDVILFSIAFSKDDSGKLSRNFGPLVHTGGERRLNVAVTRARRQVIVFCSFEPEDLRTEGMSEGLQQLSEYLRLAKYGAGASGATGSALIVAPDRHREEVAVALRARGLRVATQVGLSEFKVDIAVSRTSDVGSWSLGILTDGDAWRARATVGDRDSLPMALLADRMGWPAMTRVWTPDWLRDSEGEVDRIEALVDGVESGVAAPAAAEPPTISAVSSVYEPAPVAARVEPATSPTAIVDAPTWSEWQPPRARPAYVLDQLDDSRTREYIAALVRDMIGVEGPIQVARAARNVARAHGLDRVRDVRVRAINDALGSAMPISGDGFYFTAESGPDDYGGWATASQGARKVEEISLAEVSNAMRHIATVGLGASRDELVTAAASALGFSRVTTNIRDRLQLAVDEGVRRGVLRHEGSYIVAVSTSS